VAWLLTYLAAYVTAPSAFPVEVVLSFVAVVELPRLSSGDEEVGHLMKDLELGVSEVLGISLLDVCAWYFQDSDEDGNQDLVSEPRVPVIQGRHYI
jgi:hypothetical protein